MDENRTDYQDSRLLSKVLSLYYTENLSQSEIARQLGLSTAKVNRILQAARRQGMVEIKIYTPFQHIFELEKSLQQVSGVTEAIVVPQLSNSPDSLLQDVGRAAASYLLDHLRMNEIIALGGGRAISATVQALSPRKNFNTTVVPAVGGVQGQHFTDVNNLVAEAALRLGGSSLQLHAPAYMDTDIEREIVYRSRQVKDVLDLARQARIAVVGIGTLVVPGLSSYLHFHNMSTEELNEIHQVYHGIGELLSQAINAEGIECAPKYSKRVIGLSLDELRNIPLSIGVAAGPHKSLPIAAALKGHFLKTIILDQETAAEVVDILKGSKS
jgi:DNA-binding transcriptional regulator LsrR (DeoR family)